MNRRIRWFRHFAAIGFISVPYWLGALGTSIAVHQESALAWSLVEWLAAVAGFFAWVIAGDLWPRRWLTGRNHDH
jgi:hypothetical protein